METIAIYINSVVADLARTLTVEQICQLKQLARKEVVELVFAKDFCMITAKTSKKIKVPRKVMTSKEALYNWMIERIKKHGVR